MGRGKQIVVLVLIFAVALGCVYLGLQIKNKPETVEEEQVYLGTYKETAIPLPIINESNGEEFLQMLCGTDGQIELFTILYNEDRTVVRGYKKYILNNEWKWDEAEADWMAEEFFEDTPMAIRMIAYAESGTIYFVLHNLTAEIPENDEVMRFTTSKALERVGVRGLYKTDSDGYPIQIKKLFISGNIVCITDELSNSYAYSLITGELYASGKNATINGLACDDNYLYLMADGCNAVQPYQLSGGEATGLLKLWDRVTEWEEMESEYEIRDYQLLSQDGALYLSCQDGIYSYHPDTGEWELLLDGISCIFGRPSILQQNFVQSGDCFYMYGRDLQGASYFSMYSRRTEEEDKERNLTDFTISAYRRNAIITEAVVAFQHERPSLHIIYDVALDRNPNMTVEEYRQEVQASIQAGTAADVLVCDELDYNAYIDSGFFENISDLMKPMYTSSNLYGNVTNAMAQTKIFVTPAKLEAYFAYGESGLLKQMESLSNLQAFSERTGSPALGTLTYLEMADLIRAFYQEEYVVDGQMNPESLAAALSSFRTIASAAPEPQNDPGSQNDSEPQNGSGSQNDSEPQNGSGSQNDSEPQSGSSSQSDSEPQSGSRWLDAPVTSENAAGPGITLISTARDFASMLSCLKEAGRSYSPANGRFAPKYIVGINSKSKNIKTGKDFIRTMYSESVQQSGLGKGIPMNKSAIDLWNGSSVTEEDLELLKKNLQTLDAVYMKNPELNAVISSILKSYLEEELSEEEAVEKFLEAMP